MANDQQPNVNDKIKALLAQIPTGSAGAVPPIGGMPGSFVAHHETAGWAAGKLAMHDQATPVQYFEGDEWQPASSSPQDIASVQQQLVNGGLIPKGTSYHLGVWDNTTRLAFKEALAYANATGMNAKAALTTLASAKPAAVPSVRLMPDISTVAQTVKTTIQQKLGRDATPEEVRNLANVLMGFDQKSIDAKQAADNATPGSTVQDVDPAAQFQQYIDNQYQPEVQRDQAVTDLTKSRTTLMNNIFSLDKAIGA